MGGWWRDFGLKRKASEKGFEKLFVWIKGDRDRNAEKNLGVMVYMTHGKRLGEQDGWKGWNE